MANNQGYYGQGAPQEQPNAFPQSNPWADQTSQQPQQYQYQQPQQQQQQPQSQQSQQPQQPFGAQAGYQPPPGPPPRRADTFNETSFVPESERGEQREMMENYEMNRSKPESQTDRDVATLQQEFPSLDGSLIAALYGDSQSLSATREMLQELAASK